MIEERQCSKVNGLFDKNDRWDVASYERNKKHLKNIEAFGWNFIKEDSKPSGRGRYHFLVYGRDTDMPHYEELKQLEDEYNDVKKEIDLWDMEWETFGILLLLLIIPGIVYLVFTLNQRSKIWNNNMKCDEKMDEIVQKAKEIFEKE
ncbi:MAG: hypothetical protein K6E24_05615 [bacterium]|nr:hypothetical protein [bacterium]